MNKKIFFFLILIILFSPLFSFALIPQLQYPIVRGIDITGLIEGGTISLTDFAQFFYYFFVISGGVVAFAGLVYGGFLWLTSAGSPGKVSEARNQILASFFGLILLLSSWVILYILDPQLVIFYPFRATGVSVPTPQTKERPEIPEGYIFTTNFPDDDPYHRIEVPKGILRVEDTRRFPVYGATIDLSGTDPDHHRNLEVEFKNPINLETCRRDNQGNIIQGTCQDLYRFGIICFSETNFQGEATIISSGAGTINHILRERGRSDGNPIPCQSLLSFKQPFVSIYSSGDEITFYEDSSPPRKNPETGEILGRACIKIDETRGIENCRVLCSFLRGGTNYAIFRIRTRANDSDCEVSNTDHRRRIPAGGVFGIEMLRGDKEDEDGNLLSQGWWPSSMDVSTTRDKKYLVLLFQSTNFSGPVYELFYDVPNFADPSDTRLYWVKQTAGTPQPGSVIIIPLEPEG